MANRRFTLALSTALLVAGGSTVAVYRTLQDARKKNEVPMTAVVVAAADISDGQVVDKTALKVVEMPVNGVPAGAYRVVDSVAGRVTRVPVFKGEVFVPGRLVPTGDAAGIEVKITPGNRAMAVKIDEVAGVSGLIQPNSRVDVLVALNDGDLTQRRAKLFMANKRVLAVGAQMERGPNGEPISNAATVALEVTPDEAERLALAASEGKIQLVLRGYGDPDTVVTRGATASDIVRQLNGVPVERAPAAPTRRRSASRRAAADPVPTPAFPPVEVVQAPVAAPAPRRPDSAVVQVYRGDKLQQQKIETRRDSARSGGRLPQ